MTVIGIDISRIAVSARTGTEHYTYELLAALARLGGRHRYTLYCNRPPAELPPLAPTMAVRSIPFPRLWTHLRLSAELLSRPPDVLFVPAHVLPLGTPLARRTRAVVTLHDLGYLRFPAAHTRAQRLQLRLTTRWSAAVADRVIVPSEATRGDLVRLLGVPAAKVTVVHHGLSGRFRAPPAARPAARPYFLYVGTLQPRKNLARVIEAFAQLRRAAPPGLPPDLELVLAGKRGWLSEGIERRAAELGVADRVHVAGYISDDELPALLAGATAFIFPSLYEGFGMPVLEAMACGAPVLTSATSSLPEVAGDAAILVDPQDTAAIAAAMARLATDAELRADLRARGLRRAAQFTWERCAQQTLQVLMPDIAPA